MRAWAFAFGALLLPAISFAQDSGTVVVVQGQRLDPFRGDRVFSSTDLTAADIARAASVDLALKSHVQAGLFRRSSSLSANPTVQGIGFRAIAPSGAGRALVQLDGVPMNDPFGGWVIWSSLPQGALGRVHVLRGAGGGAYGAGAITGVIDLGASPDTPYAEARVADANHSLSAGAFGLHVQTRTLRGDAPVRGAEAGAADVPTTGRDTSWLWNRSWTLCEGCGDLSVMAGGYDSDRATGLKGATATASGQHLSVSLSRRPGERTYGYRLQLWGKSSDLQNRSVSVQPGRTGTNLANDQFATPASGYGVNAALRRRAGPVEWELGVDARLNEGEARERYRYMDGAPTRLRTAGGETLTTGIYGEGSWTQGPWLWAAALRVDEWQSRQGHRSETDLTNGDTVLDVSAPPMLCPQPTACAGQPIPAFVHPV
jgi:vitamin B12 transporter